MNEQKIIDNTKTPITTDRIVNDLLKIGVRKKDTLIVHSSLSSMGWVCGGPQAVVEALISVLGKEGTLVMPAHSGDWTDPAGWSNPPVPEEWIPVIKENMPAFDKDITYTRGMGRISDLFLRYPGTIRSNHPVVSFCARGKHAKSITETHPLEDHFGMNTPLGKLYRLGAKVLLLGVGYESCTSFHLAETMVENPELGETSGSAVMVDGERKWVEFKTIKYESDDFPKLGSAYEKEYKVAKGRVGNALCRLFDMRTGVDFATKWLTKNRIHT